MYIIIKIFFLHRNEDSLTNISVSERNKNQIRLTYVTKMAMEYEAFHRCVNLKESNRG